MIRIGKKNFFLLYYIPILVWMGVIFYLSSVPNLKTGVADISLEFVLRKIAHLLEYAILAGLFARALRAHQFDFKMILVFSLIGVVIFSLSDEMHQLFVIGRSGNFFDVGVDLIGAVFGLFIFKKITG